MEIKTKVNKGNLIKLKSFFTAEESVGKVKRQPSEWQKIIADETANKGLISTTYKKFIQLNATIYKCTKLGIIPIFKAKRLVK